VREEDLERLVRPARDKDAESRRALAASLADLFLAGAPVLTDRERFPAIFATTRRAARRILKRRRRHPRFRRAMGRLEGTARASGET